MKAEDSGRTGLPQLSTAGTTPTGPGRVFLLYALLFCYPFFSMLWRHAYPLASTEAMLYLVCVLVASFLLEQVQKRVRTSVGLAVTALALFTVLLLQFNLGFVHAGIALLCIGLLLAVAREKTPILLVPVLAAMLAGSYLDARSDQSKGAGQSLDHAGRQDLPPVIHIVLDAFIGLDGMPPGEEGALTRSRALEIFSKHGFTLFPRAYSRYSSTVDSLSNAFNFRADNFSKYGFEQITGTKHQFSENRYFDSLASLGYRIRVYQNEEMDFCQGANAAVEACWRYQLPNLDSVRQGVSDAWLRSWILLSTMLHQSSLISSIDMKNGLLSDWGVSVYEPEILPRILQDLETRNRGYTYFTHVLFPHSPFTYASNCALDYEHSPWERFSRGDGELAVPNWVRDARYLLYLRQARCALRDLDNFFEALKAQGLFDQSVIIVHGDHGSIVSTHPARKFARGQMTGRDFLDSYSTLYTVKLPFGQFLEINDALPLENLMANTFSVISQPPADADELRQRYTESASNGAGAVPYVYLLGSIYMDKVEMNLFED